MIFTKIQIAKNGTLQATYKNGDCDIVDFKGANIVHKDLREAMQALVPHLALITEQREAYKPTRRRNSGSHSRTQTIGFSSNFINNSTDNQI